MNKITLKEITKIASDYDKKHTIGLEKDDYSALYKKLKWLTKKEALVELTDFLEYEGVYIDICCVIEDEELAQSKFDEATEFTDEFINSDCVSSAFLNYRSFAPTYKQREKEEEQFVLDNCSVLDRYSEYFEYRID